MRMTCAVLICLLLALSSGTALASKRVALVIGNDSYTTLPALRNAGKDARDVASKLEGLGFEVILRLNAGERAMGRALAEFEGRLSGGDAGLVYYAGHGVQVDGRNWLIPSDARVEDETDLPYEAIDASDFLSGMERAGAPVNIVILDACRDNPLPKRQRSGARGLAVTAVPSVKGIAMLYSAGPGEAAADGPPGGNGLFTGALLKLLDRPGLTVEQVFKQTAREVNQATRGRQTPWINASLTGDFYFAPAAPTAAAPSPTVGAELELAFWQSIQNSRDASLCEAYLAQFPDGTFAPLARAKIASLKGEAVAALTAPTAPVAPVPVQPKPSLRAPEGEGAGKSQDDVVRSLGLTLSTVTPDLSQQFKLKKAQKGVVVTDVLGGSSAAEKGVGPGDVIVEVNQKEVGAPTEVAAKVEQTRKDGKKTALLLIENRESRRYVAVRLASSYRVSDLRETKWVSGRGTVNVRSGPGTDFPVVGRLGGDDEVSVTGRVEGTEWVRVRLAKDKTGFVFGSLLGFTEPASAIALRGRAEAGGIGQETTALASASYGSNADDVRIVLFAVQDSWVQIREADGNLVGAHLLRPGEEYRVPNLSGLLLLTGNAGGIELLVDGKKAPPLGPIGEIRRNVPLDPDRLLAGTALSQ